MTEPDVLGSRYEVLRTVSVGRRASVLQALDRVHDRLVALKVLTVTDEDRDELLAEARLLMSIAPHPGLPVIRGDFFTDDGDRYVLVMNWVDGTDLQETLEEQGDPGLPLQQVIEDLTQVADALDHLHSHQPPIIHGDVKPANLVRTAGGQVVLVDFDIAGAQASEGRVGTIGFVAPEVAAGEKPTPAADVFGLAATAVALLSGEPAATARLSSPGLGDEERDRLAQALRLSMSVDPSRRPQSARQLVDNLRTAEDPAPPTGMVALLATEVAGAMRSWHEAPEEMRVAMGRLRDLHSAVIGECGGEVVASTDGPDHTLSVFREASTAAVAALQLHEMVSSTRFPPGVEVRLQAAVAVGEVAVVDGHYAGAVVDHVIALRSVALPGSTITSEVTAELLLGLVGGSVSIVPLGRVVTEALPRGSSIFGLTRPGSEATAGVQRDDEPLDASAPATVAVPDVDIPRAAILLDALEHTMTLVPLTVAGLAWIYRIVLAPELGFEGLATLIAGVALIFAAASFGLRTSIGLRAARHQVDEAQAQHEAAEHAAALAVERTETRRQLDVAFARIDSSDAREGGTVLDGLVDEFDALGDLLQRTRERPTVSASSLIPDLSEETYRHGMSALSDALELLEFADGSQRRRLEAELAEIEDRLALDAYPDERARARDEQRRPSHQQLIVRHDEARQRARDLLFEAERCTAALAEARIELASVRAGDTRVDVDAVVETLQATIRRVRDVQDELRRLGY